MATMIPNLTEEQLDDLESSAEAKIYRAFRDDLPNSIHVHFSVSWILKQQNVDASETCGHPQCGCQQVAATLWMPARLALNRNVDASTWMTASVCG